MKMTKLEKRHIIDSGKLSGEAYFTSILQEAYACGLLYDSDIENIQLECIKFLAYKSERYSSGDSSSIRVEIAESIMKSNLYTIGLYLKSLPDVDIAVSEIKGAKIAEMFEKGRKLINVRLNTAKHIYSLVQKNKLTTPNYTYNATLSGNGIGSFFKSYDPDYEAHGTSASIDYQLCNIVTDLEGVEYIQKYLGNLFLENEFCKNFAAEDIHHLLCGYDTGYKDLLINIFEHVLTGALACLLAGRSIAKLYVSKEDVQLLQNRLSEYDDQKLALEIGKAAVSVLEELNVSGSSLRRYVAKSLHRITFNILRALKTNTLAKTFVCSVDLDLKPKIEFLSGKKMDDRDYGKFIDELMICRYSSDKLALIKEKVKSFGDFEDMIFDAQFSEEEIFSVFDILGDIEIAALIKEHPFESDIQDEDLLEGEKKVLVYFKNYVYQLSSDRQERIFQIVYNFVDE
jgi:hypothetical protein